MSYIGRTPEVGNYRKADSISVVNGQATYNLTVNSEAVNPNANQVICSLNGVIQSSNDSFSIASNQITFASNLQTGDVIDFILILGDTLDVGTPSDNTVGITQLNVSDGTNGQALTTNGSGTLSFADVGVDGISSSADATAITIDSSENVGIGTGSPSQKLHVAGGNPVAVIESTTSSGAFVKFENTSSTNTNRLGYAVHDFVVDTNGSEQMRIKGDGNVGIGTSSPSSKLDVNGTVTATSFSGSGASLTGVANTASVWVNFNGTGTVAIRDDYNVSSITDNGTGDYTVNFTSSLANSNYSFTTASGKNSAGQFPITVEISVSISNIRVQNSNLGSSLVDNDLVCVHIFGG